jgi:hypothetical protein
LFQPSRAASANYSPFGFYSELPDRGLAEVPNRALIHGNVDRLTDWMEWQAGYICGSLLMPKRRVDWLISAFVKENGCAGPFLRDNIDAGRLIERMTDLLEVASQF